MHDVRAPLRLGLAVLIMGVLVTAGVWAVRTFSVGRTEATMTDAEAVFGSFVASEEVRRLADASDLADVASPELPQVTAPDHAFDGSAPIVAWSAHEVDRTVEEPRVAPDARGIVVEIEPSGRLVLDQHTVFLPDERRAQAPAEVAWIAFARYVEDDRSWSQPDGASLAMERIDLRVMVRTTSRRLGRVTAEAAPPYRVQDPTELFQPNPGLVTHEIALLLDDTEPAPTVTLRPEEHACAADVMPATFSEPSEQPPRSCSLGATTECVEACTAGNAAACLSAARTMGHGWPLAAQRLSRLACIAGSAEGCLEEEDTRMTHRDPASTDEPACALRVYDQLCAVGNEVGCSRAALLRSAPP